MILVGLLGTEVKLLALKELFDDLQIIIVDRWLMLDRHIQF